ncbi:LacI family DNA-binding transcriptional regulator [Microbacterium sp. NPDC076768]|uniref:LacI family DNA-binding transcriptional regulator n=1 Tax=Microbacterium sp. NPDC076768 TaxID=3154858 RepID=UPI003438F6A1
MTPDKRVTITDIARLAGVSVGAVSFALNDRPGVSDETRKRILAIAHDLQWQPSSAARALVGSRAGVIGLAVNRPARTLGTEAFFTDLIAGIQSGLSSTHVGMHLRLVASIDEEIALYRRWHSAHQVDGVIVIDPREDDPRLQALSQMGAKAVVVGSHPSAEGSAPTVWIDDAQAAHTLFDYLVALGHQRIAYITGPAEFEHTTLRAGVLHQLDPRGIHTETIITDFSSERAADATRRLLSRSERPTAIVYDNDVMAVAGLRVTQEMGIGVPEALSLASFDDSVIAGLVRPSLTCLTRDTFELGETATKLLLTQIDSPEPLSSTSGPTPRLTVRESTGAAR